MGVISDEGWKFAFLMRLNPLIPFEIFNYAVSMTDISFVDNAIACIGTMPIVAFEVYSAVNAASLASSAGGEGGEDTSEKVKEIIVKFAVSGVLIAIVMWYGKKKYDEKVVNAGKPITDSTLPTR